ncbi:hypothetical protein [Bradyrhizobium sp. SRS-191]|uniref:hypothetical protein n=1 Tax=Bradyrhizobium sp. SRS-191 TaxID=2962606 RepID=UPI00211DA767|nr:hypothetical protein [Bradyrhizobium sp. SRS-191]
MWKSLWRTWTIDKPALLGHWLWEVLVVQLAALLDRLTLRRIIALIPVVILIIAYYHRIPIPPELMLVGDIVAYIDIFSVLVLIGILSRVTTILFVVRQTAHRIVQLPHALMSSIRGVRRRREHVTAKRLGADAIQGSDDERAAACSLAWA